MSYLSQLLKSIGTHRVETALVALIALTAGVLFLAAGSTIPVLSVLLVMTGFLFGVASWRVHRGQLWSIGTLRSLQTLDEYDRAVSEQRLRAHYENREHNLEKRHLLQLMKLTAEHK